MDLLSAKDAALSYLKPVSKEILSLFQSDLTVQLKDDQSPVTIADKRAEEFLRKNNDKDLKIIHKELLDELDKFKGKRPYRDDITFLSCRLEER